MQPSLLGLYQAIIVSSLDGMDMGVAAPWIPKVGLGKSQLLLLHKPGGSFLATALKPPSSQRGVIMIARGRVRIRTQVCLPEGGLHLLLTGRRTYPPNQEASGRLANTAAKETSGGGIGPFVGCLN